MKSTIIKRSIVIDGHKTSVSLEDAFWEGVKEIAHKRRMTLSALVGTINGQRHEGNLSSALRLFVLESYRDQGIAHPGHIAATPNAEWQHAPDVTAIAPQSG
jgi:predicted DNA-binding ribbon-helix-helix protein